MAAPPHGPSLYLEAGGRCFVLGCTLVFYIRQILIDRTPRVCKLTTYRLLLSLDTPTRGRRPIHLYRLHRQQ